MEPNTKKIIQFEVEETRTNFVYRGFIQEVPASLYYATLEARRQAQERGREERHENEGATPSSHIDAPIRASTSSPEPEEIGSSQSELHACCETGSLSSSSSVGNGSFERSPGSHNSQYLDGEPTGPFHPDGLRSPFRGRAGLFCTDRPQANPNTSETNKRNITILGPSLQPGEQEELSQDEDLQAVTDVSCATYMDISNFVPPSLSFGHGEVNQDTELQAVADESGTTKEDATVPDQTFQSQDRGEVNQDTELQAVQNVLCKKKKNITVKLLPQQSRVINQVLKQQQDSSASLSKKLITVTPLSRERQEQQGQPSSLASKYQDITFTVTPWTGGKSKVIGQGGQNQAPPRASVPKLRDLMISVRPRLAETPRVITQNKIQQASVSKKRDVTATETLPKLETPTVITQNKIQQASVSKKRDITATETPPKLETPRVITQNKIQQASVSKKRDVTATETLPKLETPTVITQNKIQQASVSKKRDVTATETLPKLETPRVITQNKIQQASVSKKRDITATETLPKLETPRVITQSKIQQASVSKKRDVTATETLRSCKKPRVITQNKIQQASVSKKRDITATETLPKLETPRVITQNKIQQASVSKKRDVTATETPPKLETPRVITQNKIQQASVSKKRDITATETLPKLETPRVITQNIVQRTSVSKKRGITATETLRSCKKPRVISQDARLQLTSSVSSTTKTNTIIAAPPLPLFKEIKISPAFMPVSENPTVKEIKAAYGMLKLNSPNTDLKNKPKEIQAAFAMVDLGRWKPYQLAIEAQVPEEIRKQFVFRSDSEKPELILRKRANFNSTYLPSLSAPLMSQSLSLLSENAVTTGPDERTATSDRLVLKTGRLQEGPAPSTTLESQAGSDITTTSMQIGLVHSMPSKSTSNVEGAHASNINDNLLPRTVNIELDSSEQEIVSSMYTLLKRNKQLLGCPNMKPSSTNADATIHLLNKPLNNPVEIEKRPLNIPFVEVTQEEVTREDVANRNAGHGGESVDFRESNATITNESQMHHSGPVNNIPPAFANESLNSKKCGPQVQQILFLEPVSSIPMCENLLGVLESGKKVKLSEEIMPVPKNNPKSFLNDKGFLNTTRKLAPIPNDTFLKIIRKCFNPSRRFQTFPRIRVNEVNTDPFQRIMPNPETPGKLNEAPAPTSRQEIPTAKSFIFISNSAGTKTYEYRPFMKPPKERWVMAPHSERLNLHFKKLQPNLEKPDAIPKSQPMCPQPPKKPRMMESNSEDANSTPQPQPVRPTCGDCSRQYYSTSHLYRHVLQKHPTFELTVPNRCTIPDIECNHYGGPATSCDICVRRINDQLDIEFRTPSHAIEYICQWCSRTFKTLVDLQKHFQESINRGGCIENNESPAQPSTAPSTSDA